MNETLVLLAEMAFGAVLAIWVLVAIIGTIGMLFNPKK